MHELVIPERKNINSPKGKKITKIPQVMTGCKSHYMHIAVL